jgi:hypothetical protein
MFLVAQIEQGREPMGGHKHDVAPIAAVSAVGAAAGHKHFPSEAANAVSAPTGLDHDPYFIDKQVCSQLPCLRE